MRDDHWQHLKELNPKREREAGTSATPKKNSRDDRDCCYHDTKNDLQRPAVRARRNCFDHERNQQPESENDLHDGENAVEHTVDLPLAQHSSLTADRSLSDVLASDWRDGCRRGHRTSYGCGPQNGFSGRLDLPLRL